MPHIDLPPGHSPGISGLLIYRPETAHPLRELVEILMRGPSSLTSAEREIIAASVSWWNNCHFCHTSHAAAACAHLGRGPDFIDEIKAGLPNEPLSPKMRALLHIAHQVQRGGKHVTEGDVAQAKTEGATDVEIHDTVLIAAAFCMFNRYVDGLNTWAWPEKEKFMEIGGKMAHEGYMKPYVPVAP
ncbi:MAG: carboxymuconolactone decarboxylase family protein [Flavobacteriales bacterium]|nr:carboxymuconolactone decarboxylase family protein [Flavobacteriales bacterium]